MPANLSEALAELQAKPPVLVKDKKGQVGNQKTKYADLVQVNEQVLSRLNELGVIYVCAPTLDDDGKFVLAYELEHVESKTSKSGRYPLKLAETSMAMGSAITYARRYVLLALTGVAAEDEDDDGQGANGQRTAQRQQRPQQAPAGQATAQRAPRPAAAQPPLPGENGNGITPPQQALLHKLLGEIGKGQRDAGLGYISGLIGKDIDTTKDLSKADATKVIDHIKKQQEQPA